MNISSVFLANHGLVVKFKQLILGLLLILVWIVSNCVAGRTVPTSEGWTDIKHDEEESIEYMAWLPLLRGKFDPVSIVGGTKNPIKGWYTPGTRTNFFSNCDKLNAQGKIAFGNIINTFECIPLENATNLDILTKLATDAVGKPVKLTRIRKLHLSPTLNDEEPLQLHMIDQFSNQIIYNVSLGINWYVSVQESASGYQRTFDNKVNNDIVHHLAWSYSRENRFVMIQHSIGETIYQYPLEPTSQPNESHQKVAHYPLISVLSYNVWNTMPHISQYWNHDSRFERYKNRLDWLLSHLKETAADIICLQEVRSDWTLPVQHQHQMTQLTSFLIPMGYNYFVFQPAMSYYGKQEFDADQRTEEGLAIFSKFPIVSTSYKLLSRERGNALDEHQRIVLHARIDVNGYLVDAFTTHLSLNKESRFLSALEILDFANKTKMIRYNLQRPIMQVITGDFNAEATDDSIRMLQGLIEHEGVHSTFKDAWLEHYEEPRPRSYKFLDMKEAFTFPSDEPKKRIDFVFYRGNNENVSVKIRDVRLIGLEPKEKQRGKRKVGMEMPNSALYASDHRGLLVDAELLPKMQNAGRCYEIERKEKCSEKDASVVETYSKSKSTNINPEVEFFDVRKGCIATLKGYSPNWSATFLYGAYTSREEGGFRERGARNNCKLIQITQTVNRQFGSCQVTIFENGDYSGATFIFQEPGEYNLQQVGYMGRKVDAIEVLLV